MTIVDIELIKNPDIDIQSLFEMTHKDFSRLDEYGDQAICFFELESKIDLRKFCYCFKFNSMLSNWNVSKVTDFNNFS